MTIDDLLMSDRPFLRQLAADAVRYKREFDGGGYGLGPEAEVRYKKLCDGLVDLEKLNRDCEDEVARERLAEAVEALQGYLLGKL